MYKTRSGLGGGKPPWWFSVAAKGRGMRTNVRGLVDQGSNIVKQFRYILNFIEQNRRLELFEKTTGIGTHAFLDVGIFKEDIPRLGIKAAQDGGFSRSPRACHDKGGKAPGRREYGFLDPS